MHACSFKKVPIDVESFRKEIPSNDENALATMLDDACCLVCDQAVYLRGHNKINEAPTIKTEKSGWLHFAHWPKTEPCDLKDEKDPRFLALPAVPRDPVVGKKIRQSFFGTELPRIYHFFSKAIGDQPDRARPPTLDLAKFDRAIRIADAQNIWGLKDMSNWKAAMLLATFVDFSRRSNKGDKIFRQRWYLDGRVKNNVFLTSKIKKYFVNSHGALQNQFVAPSRTADKTPTLIEHEVNYKTFSYFAGKQGQHIDLPANYSDIEQVLHQISNRQPWVPIEAIFDTSDDDDDDDDKMATGLVTPPPPSGPR